MRTLALLLLLPLVACQTKRQLTLPNGASYSDNGHFAGDTLVLLKPDGTAILRNKMNEPFGKLVDAGETVAGGIIYAGVQKAAQATDAAVSISAQKQATKNAAINAAVESEKIKAGVETTRILTPTPP